MIIGIDHGYYAIKTKQVCFPTGIIRYEYEPYTMQNVLQYRGEYYVCGTGRQTLVKDKTANDNYYLLTLAALAQEIRKRKGELTYEQKAGDMQQEEMLFNTITIPRSGEYKLVLSDGTKVWLNSDSKLEFPNTFVGDERRVKLAGEAYFEVAKNKAKPFRVEVDRVEVVVLGTSFNIHAYDEAVKTTLVEGAVKLNVAGKAYSLSPGFEANVDQGGVKIVKSDVYEQIAWKDGRFVFREKRLEEVMSILSRWYDFEIFYQNAAVKDLHFTGNIPRHATINEVLKFLERTHLVHFSVVGRTVIVSE